MSGLLLAAFVAGLTGGLHCVAMCGPFASSSGPGWHVGRVGAYLAAGAVAGASGRALPAGAWTSLAAAAFLTWSCLRFGGFLHGEGAGFFGRFLAPLARATRRLPGPLAAVAFGALSALLPCGLFWGALGIATAAREPAGGAAVLAAFFLGTLPALLFAGALLRRLAGSARRVVALTVLVAGLAAIAHRAGALPIPGDGDTCGHPTGDRAG